jgi:hypothetical protein
MYYWMREDFWEENMGEMLDNFEAAIPANITLSHTLCTYNVISELNLAYDKSSKLPAANVRPPPRAVGGALPPSGARPPPLQAAGPPTGPRPNPVGGRPPPAGGRAPPV